MIELPACMGGFCNCRDQCWRHLTDEREHVVERLCQRGQEMPEPVRILDFHLSDWLCLKQK